MRIIYALLFCFVFILQSCGVGEREKNLRERELTNTKKEQELLLWEQRLKIEQQEFDNKKQVDTSDITDSTSMYIDEIVGSWTVKMNCVETNCEGSAIGDSKTERWDISMDQQNINVKAFVGKTLIRTYLGTIEGNTIKIADENPNTTTTIKAVLKLTKNNAMDGSRDVIQKDCKIVYALAATRAK